MIELKEKLTELAFKRSTAFCYNCYYDAPTGRCETCGSDDLMRSVPGVGCEYGTDWVIQHILETELEPANTEEAFEQMVSDCYSETTKVAWAEFDTVTLLKQMDPVSWKIALDEYVDHEITDGNVLTIDNGSTYYWAHDIVSLLDSE